MRIFSILILFFVSSSTNGQSTESALDISHLKGDFYIFTTYNFYKGNKVPANGMYLLTDKGAVMIDSPWDTTQYQPLIDSIKLKHNKNVLMCIATHFHEDRTGGLQYFRQHGIKTYTTKQTDELSKKEGMKRAEFLIDKDTVFTIGQYSFQTYYPGKGHAPDNIVIWFEKEKILYGGCLIKSTKANNLGNLSDASINDYETTLKNVEKKCKDPEYIIPGHDTWLDNGSLKHTLKMAKELSKKTKK